MIKKLALAFVLLVAVIGGAAAVVVTQTDLLQQLKSGGRNGGPSEPVAVSQVQFADLTRTVSAPGSIEPRTMVQISSQVSAEVLALPFREGDNVKKGDVVVRLDPDDLEARLDAVKANLKAEQARLLGAEANEIRARLEYERLQTLLETGDVSQAEFETAEANWKSALSNAKAIEASIERAEADIKQAEKDLENTVIVAPMDGMIQQLNTEVGETVIVGTTNNPGSIIMEVADLSEMILKAQVDEANFEPVQEGQSAVVYINAFDDQTFSGTLRKIGRKRQVAADGTGFFEVEILIDDNENNRLYSGLTASTDISVETFYDVMVVPSQAVVDRRVDELPKRVRESELTPTNKTFAPIVFVMEDGKAAARPVRVGPSSLTESVILEGLAEGDQVISGPVRLLTGENAIADGRAVRDRDVEQTNNAEGTSDTTEGDTTKGDETAEPDRSENDDAAEENEASAAVAGEEG